MDKTNYTVKELRSLAKEKNVKGYYKMRKFYLLKILNIEPSKTVEDLKKIAKERNIKGYYKMKKSELIDILYSQPLDETFPFEDSLYQTESSSSNTSNSIRQFEKGKPLQFNIIKINEIKSRYIKKFGAFSSDYTITIRNDLSTLIEEKQENIISGALFEMIEVVKERTNFRTGDKINIVVKNHSLHYPISTEYESGQSTNSLVRKLMDKVSQILTSNEELDLTSSCFNVQIIAMPQGAKPKGSKILNLAEAIQTKRSIIKIQNNDNLCCPRAVVVGLTYPKQNPSVNTIFNKEFSTNDIIYIRKGKNLQTDLVTKLCNQLGNYNEEGFTLDDIKNLEKLINIQIIVICAENFNSVIYKGPEKDIKVYLYKNGNHFDTITKMAAFYGSSYYCHKCNKTYNNKNQHKCKIDRSLCNLCFHEEHAKKSKNRIFCNDCNRYCFSQECFDNHQGVCDTEFKCLVCNKICMRNKVHNCGIEKCRNCWKEVEIKDHKCYMQWKRQKGGKCQKEKCFCKGNKDFNPDELSKCTYTENYIFFDYESQQETSTHIPNLVIAHDFIGKEFSFNTNDEFCKWLISKKHKNYTCIAHYAKAYDSQFILKYCVENTLKPYTIYNGSKLMLLEISSINLKIIDSSNFIQGPLADFPKTFGLSELKKGYFPHLFNTKENENYIGPIPDKEFYCYNQMKPEGRKNFLEWYLVKVQDNYIFDLKKELEEYCRSDVDILRRGCLKFREEFLEIANIDPFQYLTIASVCMAIYRSKYIKEDTIAVVDEPIQEKYSKQSISWLNSLGNPNIKHALNGGEQIICGAKVDGFDENSNTVYQYHGCFWHGCEKCFSECTINNVNKEEMGDLYSKTKERSDQIKKAGYNLIEMWDCNWIKSKQYKNSEKPEIIESLNPRDAFFGGRTNAFKLLAKSTKNKKIKYIDVCSLYPTVQYYDYYPVGHPEKFIKPENYNKYWFGIIKCKVLPPKNLYHPVLPVKVKMGKNEKLLFPLCLKCAEEKCRKCHHSENERMITGTWATIEVNKAIAKGYKIEEIYEVWDFKKKTHQLFKGYVRDFMKLKLETSPHNYNSNYEYIDDIKEKIGINLDPKKIIANPGKRAVSKICLNSLWGKFGQRQNMSKTEYVSDVRRFYEILLDDRLTDINVNYLTDEMAQMSYKFKDYYVENNTTTNIYIALFTTANARLRLYEKLDELSENVIYCDTDSIVYYDKGENTIKTGDMLGEWTDELKQNEFIKIWSSTGPKSYYYETNLRKNVTKIKGFTLNYQNLEKLNGNTMIRMIRNEVSKIFSKKECETENVELEYNEITRDVKTKNLVNKRVSKIFKFEYDKRIILPNYDTLPYGFHDH